MNWINCRARDIWDATRCDSPDNMIRAPQLKKKWNECHVYMHQEPVKCKLTRAVPLMLVETETESVWCRWLPLCDGRRHTLSFFDRYWYCCCLSFCWQTVATGQTPLHSALLPEDWRNSTRGSRDFFQAGQSIEMLTSEDGGERNHTLKEKERERKRMENSTFPLSICMCSSLSLWP